MSEIGEPASAQRGGCVAGFAFEDVNGDAPGPGQRDQRSSEVRIRSRDHDPCRCRMIQQLPDGIRG